MTQFELQTILEGLNHEQKQAVTASPDTVLQVIAGPGTGKTKVLTSRVAYLLLHHHIPPETIIVTTFTKKAANEMKERLRLMLQGYDTINLDKLLIGTFHGICVKILRRYGGLIGWDHFKVAAERDVDDVMSTITVNGRSVKELQKNSGALNDDDGDNDNAQDQEEESKVTTNFRASISSLKSKGLFAEDYLNEKGFDQTLGQVYEQYDTKMKKLKLLDFDDLLLYTHKLLKNHKVLKRLRHVLIDEFQDTNTLQLHLMHSLSSQNLQALHYVTVVGDPDQSIYGFRDAESLNFRIMRQEIYKNQDVQIVKLSENYRSTQSVLDISETLMMQQSDRTKKSLTSQMDHSIPPVLFKSKDFKHESTYIAHEIKQMKSLPNSPYGYSDMVILLRASFLSRELERSLTKLQIPYEIVKGKAFWERKEVACIIDFLRAVNDSNDKVAILRTFKITAEGVGSATIDKIDKLMDECYVIRGERALNVLRRLKSGGLKIPRVNGAKIEKSLASYLGLIDRCTKLIKDNDEGECLNTILKAFDMIVGNLIFKENVINVDDKAQEREENVMEVRSFLENFENEEIDSSLTDDPNTELTTEESSASLLSNFITSVDLYLAVSKEEGDDKIPKDKVSISTIHAAKGLEWSIAFIPSLKENVLPFKKSIEADQRASSRENKLITKEIDEERRVLYVALTRAKHFIYLSYSDGQVSRFIDDELKRRVVCSQKIFKDVEKLGLVYDKLVKEKVKMPTKEDLESMVRNYTTSFQSIVTPLGFQEEQSEFSGNTTRYKSHNKDCYTSAATTVEVLMGRTVGNRTRFAPNTTTTTATNTGTTANKVTTTISITTSQVPALATMNKNSNDETSGAQPLKRRKTLGMRRGPLGPISFKK